MTAEQKMDPYQVVQYPLSTEKSIRLMESQNKLIFVVALNATKPLIKESIEKIFNAKVQKVNTFITPQGEKRAYVKFDPEFPAIEIATQTGMM